MSEGPFIDGCLICAQQVMYLSNLSQIELRNVDLG
jgi:hypothetical protein